MLTREQMIDRLDGASGFTGGVLPKSAIDLAYQVVAIDCDETDEGHARTVQLVAAGLAYGYQIAAENTKAPTCEAALARRVRTIEELREELKR